MMESHKKLDSGSAGLQAGEFATISNWGLQPARDLLFPPLVRLSLRPRFYGFALQRRNRLIVHVPHLQDAKDNTTGESGARQAAKHLGRVLLRCRFSDALALQILSRQLLLVDVLVRRTDRLVDDVTMDTLGLQILHHALAPKLLVFPAKAGVALGVISVIQILLFLKFSNYYFNQQFTIKLGLDSLPYQPLQLGDSAHLASQRANGVLVQHRFVVYLLRASERHGAIISIHPIRHPERRRPCRRSRRTCFAVCHPERSDRRKRSRRTPLLAKNTRGACAGHTGQNPRCRFTLLPSSGRVNSGNPIDRRPRLRLAVHPTHRAPHPRTKRLLRRSPLHRAAKRNPELRARRHHSLRRPFVRL